VLIVTGLFYLYPQSAPEEVLGFAGLWPMAQAHYLAGLLGTLFLIFHAYIGTIGGLTRIIFGR
jgi:thiosulfate reductase cytochrome b subunit